MVRLTSDIPHGPDCFVAHLGLLSSPQEIHHLFSGETPNLGNPQRLIAAAQDGPLLPWENISKVNCHFYAQGKNVHL